MSGPRFGLLVLARRFLGDREMLVADGPFEHDAIEGFGSLLRHDSFGHIGSHQLGLALQRVAVPTATGAEAAHAFADSEGASEEVVRSLECPIGFEMEDAAGWTVCAAEQIQQLVISRAISGIRIQ